MKIKKKLLRDKKTMELEITHSDDKINTIHFSDISEYFRFVELLQRYKYSFNDSEGIITWI